MTLDIIAVQLAELKKQGLYRSLRRVEGEQGPIIRLDGGEVLNFSSNNYLGLANHPDLADASKEAIDRYGCGSGASRLISGNMTLHIDLEEKIADFKGTEAALVFNSGFQANVGILSSMMGEGDIIFSDALNHASIIDGCRLSRATVVVYSHCDLDRLESELRKAPHEGKRLIVTETVFSMDGDVAPVGAIVELAERFDSMVMVDEAHATGVFGPEGAGVVAKYGLAKRVAIQMGTLGKALGGFGAYVASSKMVRDLLVNQCRSFIFTTSLPPAVLAAASAALDLVRKEPERRQALWNNSRSLREGLIKLGYSIGRNSSQILPLIVGDASDCMNFAEKLLQRGIYTQGIRPPTVPNGTSRLRITPMATHTQEQIGKTLRAFAEVHKEHAF